MAVNINATTTSGLQISSDNSGAITLQNNGTTAISLNADGTVGGTFLASSSDIGGVNTTGTITSGTTSLTVASATNIVAGMYVVGQGIAFGTTVSSIVGTTVTLSATANATLSSAPVTFYRANKVLTPASVGGQLCRAWVAFNGTGTITILASANVSSITDNGVGNYLVNLTNAMPDANYATTCIATDEGNNGGKTNINYLSAPSTTQIPVVVIKIGTGTAFNVGSQDSRYVAVAAFR